MCPRRFSASEEKQIVQFYQQGYSTTEIAEPVGCAINTVRSVLVARGVELRNKCSRLAFTRAQLRQICAMYKRGATMQEIAEEFECSAPSIHGLLKKAGVKTRSRGKRAETKRRTRT